MKSMDFYCPQAVDKNQRQQKKQLWQLGSGDLMRPNIPLSTFTWEVKK